MAYNNYYPNFYQPPQPQYVNQPQQSGGINWVQGENSAKSYPVASGQSVLLMDSESSVFYIKSTDQSGMPLPLRIFDYKERVSSGTNQGQTGDKSETCDYVSREEFDKFKADVMQSLKVGEG